MAETSEKITRKGDVTVRIRRGLDLRGAGALVQLVNGFASHITVAKGREIADARSMLDLVSLSAAPGSCLHLTVTGYDADSAFNAVKRYFAETC